MDSRRCHILPVNQGLAAGQVITTGSYAGALDVPLATPLTITCGDLGKIEVTLIPVG